MRVRAEGVNFGKLARGILHRAAQRLATDVDAMGDASVSNAVKAVALANAFAERDAPPTPGVAFIPELVDHDDEGEDLKLLRLSLLPLPESAAASKPRDFAKGGIYVPTAVGGAFGPDVRATAAATGLRGSKARAMADAYLPLRAETPTELARVIVRHWMRYTSGGPEATAKRSAPFLLTRGPPALGRAARALALACEASRVERQAARGLPPLAVEPRLWERLRDEGPAAGRGADEGAGRRGRFVALVLVTAPKQS